MGERTERQKTLADDQVVEPDRNIVRLKRVGKRVLALGLQELLLEFRESRFHPLWAKGSEGDALLYDAAEANGMFVVSGLQARSPVVGIVDLAAGSVTYEPIDLEPGYSPRIMVLDGEMFVYSGNKIVAGVPGRWRTYRNFGADRIAEILRDGTGQLLVYLQRGVLISL